MRKILIFNFFVLCNALSFAQSKSGIVEYEIAAVDVPFKEGNSQNDMVKSLIEMAKTQKYELKFNSNFSSFMQVESLDNGQYDENLLRSAKSVYATLDSYFIDGTKKELITKTDDNILVKSDAIASGWKISTETKMIDTYLCYKATYTSEFVARNNKIKTKTITAWFAPSLPFPYGPIEFHGLPGLILELNKDYTTYLAKKIVFVNQELKTDFPKGKTITKDEYEKVILKY
ncbi:GLPGLI family protein [Flavobacterium sp.]|uniref:GLPGLI family protein n=1 Tax=Flavobacterium sp. TaxID=239 RepID=UPI0037BE9C61